MQTAQFQLHAEIEERHWWFVARRTIVRRLVESLAPPGNGTLIVDVGCGTGANIASFRDAYECLGVDASNEAIELARQRFPDVRFLAGFAPDSLGAAAQEASLFLMMDVLEHVSDDFEVLSRLVAASRPGAHFLLTVPADMALWSAHDASFGHYRRYDRRRFEQTWSGLPVTCRLLSHFNSRLYWLIRAIRFKNQLRGKAAGAAGTDFWLPAAPLNRLLERLFAGESNRLLRILAGSARPYTRGASLIAILRRDDGPAVVRQKPSDLPPDPAGGPGS